VTLEPEQKGPSTGSKQPIALPIRKAMPPILLAVFGLLSVAALGAGIWLLLNPATLSEVRVEQHRLAPADGLTHQSGRLAPAPTPSVIPTVAPACAAFADTKIIMSGDGVLRINEALQRLCRLSGGGVPTELATAIDGLAGATIRFAQFDFGDLEATSSDSTIWINLRFARRDSPIEHLLPPLLHEAFHLANGVTEPTAAQELGARAAELAACRELIPRDEWPRWCQDAEELTTMDESEAIRRLVSAGYQRGQA
jgi:hypothetical protein